MCLFADSAPCATVGWPPPLITQTVDVALTILPMRTLLIALVTLSLGAVSVEAQAPVTVFKGRPSVKVSEGGIERAPEQGGASPALRAAGEVMSA